jgi:hypothetical protein
LSIHPVYRHPGLPLKFAPFPPSPSLVPLPLTHLSQLIRRCEISKRAQLPRRCVLPRPAPVLSFFLSFYFPSVVGGVQRHGWWQVSALLFCCYIAGRSSVWSDVRLCIPPAGVRTPSAVRVAAGCCAPMGIRKHRTMINCPNDRFGFGFGFGFVWACCGGMTAGLHTY